MLYRKRTYRAAIVGTNGRNFDGRLSGAPFYRNYDSCYITTSSSGTKLWLSSVCALTQWLEDRPLFERVGDSGYVSVLGAAQNIPVDAKVTTASTAWVGSFNVCASAKYAVL